MKKIVKYLVICSIMLVSCGDEFLNLHPQSSLNSEGYYQNQTDMNRAVLAAYADLRSLYNARFVDMEIRSDNTAYQWLPGDPANHHGIDDFRDLCMITNTWLNDTWNSSYRLILRCNTVITRIDNASFFDENLRTQYEAEARFLRALMYFWLNRIFGGYATNGELLGVCKVEKPISQFEAYEIVRAPYREIYDLIVADLMYAETNLPLNYPAADRGRVRQAGASAMLAKVYMFMAGYPLNLGNEYYLKAVQQIEHFFNTYPDVSLAQTYQHLFSSPHNQTLYSKNSVESLFEVQYRKGAPGEATNSPWNGDFAPRNSDGVVIVSGTPSGTNSPTTEMAEAYEFGDPRRYVSMRDGFRNNASGDLLIERYVCKYYDVPNSGNNNGNNWIELRLADIYLLYAEALVRTNGNRTVALNYLNRIRERARNTPGNPGIVLPEGYDLLKDYSLSDFADDDEFLMAIEKERRIELAFENHRWFDLVRTQRARDVMSTQWGISASDWNDAHLALPIPETVMLSNPGKIIQNRGYTQR